MSNGGRVALVGGPDVDARLHLMDYLQGDFEFIGVGSEPTLDNRFSERGYTYQPYRLSRKVDPLADLITVWQLTNIFRHTRSQIVHAFDTKPRIWGSLAARIAGVPVVICTLTGFGTLYASDGASSRRIRYFYERQAEACSLRIRLDHIPEP